MGGCYITTLLAKFPRMVPGASLYGVNIVIDKPDSAHLVLPYIRGELYYAFAEHDASVPAHVVPELKASLAKADLKATVKIFDGTHHSFCFAERAVYDTAASEQT